MQASLGLVEKLQGPEFQKAYADSLAYGWRYKMNFSTSKRDEKFIKQMTSGELDMTNRGFGLLYTVIDRMKEKISRGLVSLDNMKDLQKMATEKQRGSGETYNEGIMVETLTNWLTSFKQEQIDPKKVDAEFLSVLCRDIYQMMYKINEHGNARKFVDNPRQFNDAAIDLDRAYQVIKDVSRSNYKL
ncbi:MAG: hypothetical protein Q7S57_02105 [bacterium]|nr:hypothetical protein [bacterium]